MRAAKVANKITAGVLESAVMEEVETVLSLSGLYFWRNNSGVARYQSGASKRFIRYGFPGSADFLGVTNDGRILAVECKRPSGGVVSEKQKVFLTNIHRRGGVALVVRSGAELLTKLKELKIV